MDHLIPAPMPKLDEDIDHPLIRRWQALYFLSTGLTPWAVGLEHLQPASLSLCEMDDGPEWIMCCGCLLDKRTGEAWLKHPAVKESTDRLGRRCIVAGDETALHEQIAGAWSEVLKFMQDCS